MGVQGNSYGSVSHELLDELVAGALGEEQRGAGVPEVVEAQVLPYAGAGLDALERTVTRVRVSQYILAVAGSSPRPTLRARAPPYTAVASTYYRAPRHSRLAVQRGEGFS